VDTHQEDTPLDLAIRSQQWDVVEALTAHYTDVYLPWHRSRHEAGSGGGGGAGDCCYPLVAKSCHLDTLMEEWPSFLPSVLPKLDLMPCHNNVQVLVGGGVRTVV
jgi:hypothetical protein